MRRHHHGGCNHNRKPCGLIAWADKTQHLAQQPTPVITSTGPQAARGVEARLGPQTSAMCCSAASVSAVSACKSSRLTHSFALRLAGCTQSSGPAARTCTQPPTMSCCADAHARPCSCNIAAQVASADSRLLCARSLLESPTASPCGWLGTATCHICGALSQSTQFHAVTKVLETFTRQDCGSKKGPLQCWGMRSPE